MSRDLSRAQGARVAHPGPDPLTATFVGTSGRWTDRGGQQLLWHAPTSRPVPPPDARPPVVLLTPNSCQLREVVSIGFPRFGEGVGAAGEAMRNRMIRQARSTPRIVAIYHVISCGRTGLAIVVPATAQRLRLGDGHRVTPPVRNQCLSHSKIPSYTPSSSAPPWKLRVTNKAHIVGGTKSSTLPPNLACGQPHCPRWRWLQLTPRCRTARAASVSLDCSWQVCQYGDGGRR